MSDYLQVELWTATRCEVHERRVYVDLQVRSRGVFSNPVRWRMRINSIEVPS